MEHHFQALPGGDAVTLGMVFEVANGASEGVASFGR